MAAAASSRPKRIEATRPVLSPFAVNFFLTSRAPRNMAVTTDYLAYVIDQFAPFAKVISRRMFGGVGLYADGLFFGLIDDDTLYLKVDDSNRDDYVSRGCVPFRPLANDPDAYSMSYFQLPEDVLEDPDTLRFWARKALAVAAASAAAKARRKSPGKARPTAKKKTGTRPRRR